MLIIRRSFRLVYFCLQSRTRDGRECPVATLWTVWCCSGCQGRVFIFLISFMQIFTHLNIKFFHFPGYQGFADKQVQRFWLRDNDKLWWSSSGDSITQWLHTWKSSLASQLQNQQYKGKSCQLRFIESLNFESNLKFSLFPSKYFSYTHSLSLYV